MLPEDEKRIKVSLEAIENKVGIPFSDYKLSELIEDDYIEIPFDDEIETITYPIDDLIKYAEGIDTFRYVDNSTVRTDLCIQTSISGFENRCSSFIEEIQSYVFKDSEFEIKIINNPFLIGLYNFKEGNSDDNYGITPCSRYYAIELRYTSNKRKYNDQEEYNAISRVLYYLTSTYKQSFTKSKFISMDEIYSVQDEELDYENEHKEENNGEKIVCMDKLVRYTSLLEMYRKAASVEDNEIRFLSFYKMIEYVAPVVAKKQVYESLNKKLDFMDQKEWNYTELDSLLSIAKKYDKAINDKDLAKTVLDCCVSVADLASYLPEKKKTRIEKQLKNGPQFEWHSLKDEQLVELRNFIANVLYSTRNSIVHAKSNYSSTGFETSEDEFEDMNELIRVLCLMIIKWNNRQTSFLKIN